MLNVECGVTLCVTLYRFTEHRGPSSPNSPTGRVAVLTGRVASLLQGPAVVPLVPLVPLQVVSLGGHFTVLLLLLLLRPGPAY